MKKVKAKLVKESLDDIMDTSSYEGVIKNFGGNNIQSNRNGMLSWQLDGVEFRLADESLEAIDGKQTMEFLYSIKTPENLYAAMADYMESGRKWEPSAGSDDILAEYRQVIRSHGGNNVRPGRGEKLTWMLDGIEFRLVDETLEAFVDNDKITFLFSIKSPENLNAALIDYKKGSNNWE